MYMHNSCLLKMLEKYRKTQVVYSCILACSFILIVGLHFHGNKLDYPQPKSAIDIIVKGISLYFSSSFARKGYAHYAYLILIINCTKVESILVFSSYHVTLIYSIFKKLKLLETIIFLF